MDGAIVGSFLQTRPGAHRRPSICAGPSPFRGSAGVLYVSKNHTVKCSRSIPRKMAGCCALLRKTRLRLLMHHAVASSVGLKRDVATARLHAVGQSNQKLVLAISRHQERERNHIPLVHHASPKHMHHKPRAP
jgi:hypothetical protein